MVTKRRDILRWFALSSALAVAAPNAGPACPVCAGTLVTVGTASFAGDKPSKNLAVWNSSYHGIQGFTSGSPICSRCFAVYRESLSCWERSSEDARSFLVPLERSISEMPLPEKTDTRYSVVYSQEFSGADATGECIEAVGFWCLNRESIHSMLRRHAAGTSVEYKFSHTRDALSEMYVRVTVRLPNKLLERTRAG
jgi:hypothetical protein